MVSVHFVPSKQLGTGSDDDGGEFDLDAYTDLAPEHAAELAASAIPPGAAHDQGVCTVYAATALPGWAPSWLPDEAFPVIAYPMVHPDGAATGQVKPVKGSVTAKDGRELKYVSPGKDQAPPKLTVLREVDDPKVVVIVEGVKQALAVLAYAPKDWSVYRITGIWAWREGGAPTPLLAVAQGRDVVIIPDADAAGNIDVFDGATALGEACTQFGAKSVRFARIPGANKDGVDDVLARIALDRRQSLLESWVRDAKSKPADLTKPRQQQMRQERAARRAHKQAEEARVSGDLINGRPLVDLGGDALEVSHQLSEPFVNYRDFGDGTPSVFRRGGQTVRVGKDDRGNDVLESCGRAEIGHELIQRVRPFKRTATDVVFPLVPDAMLDEVAQHRARLPWLAGIANAPVVREDGTIATTPGFDERTSMFLALAPDVRGLEVPEHPSDADIEEARDLLRDEVFAVDGKDGFDGFLFRGVADQTNAVAGLITPTVRSLVGKVPLGLFNGISPGVGKGALASLVAQVTTGKPAEMQPAPNSDEEMDKRITSMLQEGSPLIIFDEVQDEDGSSRLRFPSLRAALTADIHVGRRLGKSEMLRPPNSATWLATANNARVLRDMARRVFPVNLYTDRPEPENRNNFRVNLDRWVPANRSRILRACLILVRAWFDHGQPSAPMPFELASFSEWQRILGGILHLAGFDGFLGNVSEFRITADDDSVEMFEHLEWVAEKFPPGTPFDCRSVLVQAKADPNAAAPAGVTFGELDARQLSRRYGQNRKWFGNLRICETGGKLHGGGKAYVIEELPTGVVALPAPKAAAAPAADPTPGDREAPGEPGELIEFTDRNKGAQQVARAMPPVENALSLDEFAALGPERAGELLDQAAAVKGPVIS